MFYILFDHICMFLTFEVLLGGSSMSQPFRDVMDICFMLALSASKLEMK